MVDEEGVEFSPDFKNYQGVTRDVLKAIATIAGQSKREIRWGKDEPGIDLTAHAFLLWQLKRCDNFVDLQGQPVVFGQEEASLKLLVEGQRQLECKLVLDIDQKLHDPVHLINETYAFHDNVIYPLRQYGVAHSTLTSFETLILPSELEKYLSLFVSYCPEIDVVYKAYHLERAAAMTAKPALMIEKVLPDQSVYLRVVDAVPGFDPDFAEQFDVTHVAEVDDTANQIRVRKIQKLEGESPVLTVRRLLNQLKTSSEEQLDFYQDNNFFIVDYPLSEQFIRESLPQLLSDFMIFGSEKLGVYRIQIQQPQLNLSFDHGIDFLEGEAVLDFSGERFTLFEALHQFRKNAYVQLTDGTRALMDHEYAKKLERIFQKSDEGVKVSFFDLPLLEEILEKRIEGDRYRLASDLYKGFLGLNEQSVDIPSIDATLRPYQIDGYKWLRYLYTHQLNGCLADDMGLGKTLQALTLLASIYPGQPLPSLIIVPKSLVFNWLEEIRRFCPNLEVSSYYGTDRDLAAVCHTHLVLTTYGTVRNDIERLNEQPFHYLILDESQAIKNHESQISRAVSVLNADHRLALSGTPIENNLSELYALFRFLNPAMFGSLARFQRQYLAPIQHEGNGDVARELKTKIYPFILRRLKTDVLEDLPDKVEKLIYVEMTADQQRFYEQRRQFYYDAIRNRIESEGLKNSQFFVLQAITVLRQIASIPEVRSEGGIVSPKRSLLNDMLEEAIGNGHKVLLFANFLGVLDYLALDLSEKGIDFETLTGATRDRQAPVNRFQRDELCKVFLMTLKTGGQGLNLTAADKVFIFDPWWNLAAENQAIDRSHRIGQHRTVFSYKLITKDTIEERILHLQHKKKAIFENIISDESISFHHLVEEDIDYLIG